MNAILLYGARGGRYTLKGNRPFETGRHSVFWIAAKENGEEVCVKLFRELEQIPDNAEKLDEFLREVVASQQIKHPNVLPILDYGTEDALPPKPFLVMRLCKGGDVGRLLSQRQYLPLEEALAILRPVASALDYGHASGIIHGDVKPENILLSEDKSEVYLTDFGMSRRFRPPERSDRKLASLIRDARQWVVGSATDARSSPPARERRISAPAIAPGGTPHYNSPEQLKDGKETHRSDIYSFATVAYELLTGRLPFDDTGPAYAQMRAVVEGHLVPPKEVNARLSDAANDALLLGLSVEPERRPATATQLCDMIIGAVPLPQSPRRGSGRSLRAFWDSLQPASKIALIGVLVGAVAGVITAIIQIIPDLLR